MTNLLSSIVCIIAWSSTSIQVYGAANAVVTVTAKPAIASVNDATASFVAVVPLDATIASSSGNAASINSALTAAKSTSSAPSIQNFYIGLLDQRAVFYGCTYKVSPTVSGSAITPLVDLCECMGFVWDPTSTRIRAPNVGLAAYPAYIQPGSCGTGSGFVSCYAVPGGSNTYCGSVYTAPGTIAPINQTVALTQDPTSSTELDQFFDLVTTVGVPTPRTTPGKFADTPSNNIVYNSVTTAAGTQSPNRVYIGTQGDTRATFSGCTYFKGTGTVFSGPDQVTIDYCQCTGFSYGSASMKLTPDVGTASANTKGLVYIQPNQCALTAGTTGVKCTSAGVASGSNCGPADLTTSPATINLATTIALPATTILSGQPVTTAQQAKSSGHKFTNSVIFIIGFVTLQLLQ